MVGPSYLKFAGTHRYDFLTSFFPMKYTVEGIVSQRRHQENMEFLFFYGHVIRPGVGSAHELSQWFSSPFKVDDVVYHTAEHWMMAQKALLFEDRRSFEIIVSNPDPAKAKENGRTVNGFDQAIWESRRYQIVRQGNIHKFQQNTTLGQDLIATGSKVLVEASPYDTIWGIGLSNHSPLITNPSRWRGQNLLGFALMEVRDLLNEDQVT